MARSSALVRELTGSLDTVAADKDINGIIDCAETQYRIVEAYQ